MTAIPETQFSANNGLKKRSEVKYETLKEILLSSTIHGITNITRTKRRTIFVVWSFFSLISTCTGFYFVIKDTLDYLEYNAVTTMKVISERKIEFPTV